jgi:hypothetical protein
MRRRVSEVGGTATSKAIEIKTGQKIWNFIGAKRNCLAQW